MFTGGRKPLPNGCNTPGENWLGPKSGRMPAAGEVKRVQIFIKHVHQHESHEQDVRAAEGAAGHGWTCLADKYLLRLPSYQDFSLDYLAIAFFLA